jgi:uncharacterized protein
MLNRDAIITKLREAKPALKSEFPLHEIALFGSYARSEQRATSDIDILVDVDPSIGLQIVTLADRLEELLGQKVDLLSRRALSPAALSRLTEDLIPI